MDLHDYLGVLRRRWITVVAILLATVAGAAAITLASTPQYTASTRLFFAVQGGESATDLAQGSSFTERQMASYAQVARSPLVLEPVAETLEVRSDESDLSSLLDITVAAETTILVIAATDADPVFARDLANAVADQVADTVGELSPERPDGSETVRATKLSAAEVPQSPSSPNVQRNLTLGAILGLLAGMGIALLREVRDTRVRDEGDVAATTDVTVMGSVPADASGASHPVFMHDDSMSQRAEAIRRLRTNLQFVAFGDRPSSIVVTSSVPGEGKTTTAINLAASLADAGARVILVDADLRRPSVAKYMGLEGRVGLTTVLIGRASVNDVMQPWHGTTLDVLASGQVPPNPSELLGSRAMSRLLTELAGTYDVIVLDSPPLLPVTDAAILSKLVGGALVVASADGLHRKQLRASLDALDKVDAHVLGIVLNKVLGREHDRYAYEYYSDNEAAPTRRSAGGGRSSRRSSSRAPKRSTRTGGRAITSRR